MRPGSRRPAGRRSDPTEVQEGVPVSTLASLCRTGKAGSRLQKTAKQIVETYRPLAEALDGADFVLWKGHCSVHALFRPEHVDDVRRKYPGMKVIVHPECRPEVVALADAVLSTSQMLRYVKASSQKSFIIGTEEGLLHPLRKENPGKSFHMLSNIQVCIDMKKTTLTTLAETMEMRRNRVTVPEEIRLKAKQAVERMITVR